MFLSFLGDVQVPSILIQQHHPNSLVVKNTAHAACFFSKDETNTKAHQTPTYLRQEVSEVKREKNKEAVTLVAVFFLELLHASI